MVHRNRIRGTWALVTVLLTALSVPAWAAPPCALTLRHPAPGNLVRPFHPVKQGGHWGVDLASPAGAVVRAPVSGTVTFAGEVAGMLSVTLAPRPRVRVSLSYLSELWVVKGGRVGVGQPLGRSGADHGIPAVHLSVRVDGLYVDPWPALACGARVESTRSGLRLLPTRIPRRREKPDPSPPRPCRPAPRLN